MLFHFNNICNLVKPTTVFKNVEISYISEVKCLAINISNNQIWNTHIQLLCSKLNKVSYVITSLRGDLHLYIFKKYVFCTISVFNKYGIILWSGEIENVKVLRIQKRVLHTIKGPHKRASYRPIFNELKILSDDIIYI